MRTNPSEAAANSDPDGWPQAERLGRCLSRQRTEPLCHLARGPVSVGRLAAAMDLDIKAVSKHLRLLRSMGLVECRRQGCVQIYQLSSAVRIRRTKESVWMRIAVGTSAALVIRVRDRAADAPSRIVDVDAQAASGRENGVPAAHRLLHVDAPTLRECTQIMRSLEVPAPEGSGS